MAKKTPTPKKKPMRAGTTGHPKSKMPSRVAAQNKKNMAKSKKGY